MSDYKIIPYMENLIEAYQEPVERVEGLIRNPKEVIRTVEFYSQDQYLSGNLDELGREKPFINQGNSRVRVAKTATDIDVKDIKYEADSLKYAVQTMIINRELFEFLKDINFSKTLNDMGITRPKYGGVLVKKYDDGEGVEIEKVDWVNVDFDPSDVLGGAIIETHHKDPSELIKRAEVWGVYDTIGDVLEAHAKKTKNKPAKIEIKEITGEFPYSFDPSLEENETNDEKFKTMCFYIACVGKKKFLLYKEDIKGIEDKYMYLSWEEIGKSLGRGVWEEGFESQIWSNDQYIQMKNHLDLSGKVFTKGTVKGIGNAIVGVDNGHHFELKGQETLEAFQLSTASLPQFTNLIEQFANEYNRISSTFDANTGEQPPSGTPLGQTQILNQVANSPFQYQQEVWAIWLNEMLNNWILPEVKRRILKDHNLVADYSDEELDIIDEAIAVEHTNKALAEAMFNRVPVTPELQQITMQTAKDSLKKSGKKRELQIPAKFLDVKGKITANISGELKNKGAMLQSLDNVFTKIISTYNPNTGKYAALEDPTLRKIFNQIMEIAGIPNSAVLGGSPSSNQVDLSTQTMGQPAPVMA